MFVMKKNLREVIELFPSRTLFCMKADVDDGLLSKLMSNDKKEVPPGVMANIQAYLGWSFDDLFQWAVPQRSLDSVGAFSERCIGESRLATEAL